MKIAKPYIVTLIISLCGSLTSQGQLSESEIATLQNHKGAYSNLYDQFPTVSQSDADSRSSLRNKYIEIKKIDSKDEYVRIEKTLGEGIVEYAMIADELLVGLKENVSTSEAKRALASIGQDSVESELGGKALSVNLPSFDVDEFDTAIAKIRTLERIVEYVEPNFLFTINQSSHTEIPDDPDFSMQWSLNHDLHADINAPEAWFVQNHAKDVVVAVIDTGVMSTHPDLVENIHVYQNDYVNNDNVANDDHGHGTHVAGIIGADGNNNIGVAGVAWDVKIMPLKVFDHTLAVDTVDIANAILYASSSADIINMSFGGTAHAPEVFNALKHAQTRNVLFVCTAGNDARDNDTTPYYPAAYSAQLGNIIVVASTKKDGSLKEDSNFGSIRVDIAAPGESILSTYNDGNYLYANSTSTSAPIVSGAAALLIQRFGGTPAEIIERLKHSVDVSTALQGKVSSNGRLNLQRAMSKFSKLPSSNGSSWRESDWFGWVSDEKCPWYFHETLGWYYTKSKTADEFWMYHDIMQEWLWTSSTTDSFYYRSSDETWLFYDPGSTNPQWWYNQSTNSWETY